MRSKVIIGVVFLIGMVFGAAAMKAIGYSTISNHVTLLTGASDPSTKAPAMREAPSAQQSCSTISDQSIASEKSPKDKREDGKNVVLTKDFSKTLEIAVISPKKEIVKILDKETEGKLQDLIRDSFSGVKVVAQKQGADGAVDVSGHSEDGRNYYRHFNSREELTKEGWNDPKTDESVYRAFYNSGEIKQMSWVRPDKGISSLSFNQSGTLELRYDKMADGTSFSTNYDDAGEVKTIWETTPDGKHKQLFP